MLVNLVPLLVVTLGAGAAIHWQSSFKMFLSSSVNMPDFFDVNVCLDS